MDKIKFVKCESGLVFALDEVETIVPEGDRYRVYFKLNNAGEVYHISQADYDRLMELLRSQGFM